MCIKRQEIMSLFLLIHPSSTSGTNNGHAIEFNLTKFVFELNDIRNYFKETYYQKKIKN